MNTEPLRILLADPETGTRETIRRTLECAGFNVQTVTTGADVLVMCEVEPPDVVIMELHLPDMDGFDVCERVRHEVHDSDVTIIVTTEPDDDMTRAYLGPMVDFAGGDYFLAKPCDGKLIATLLVDMVHPAHPQSTPKAAASPTRAVWPTTRSYSMSSFT